MIIRAAKGEDLQAITEIYNDAILRLPSTFDEEPKSMEDRLEWFRFHQNPRYPLLSAVDSGEVVGWGSISPFHPRNAYRFTGETSIYVRKDMYGRGIGSALLGELVRAAAGQGYHSLMALIVGGNEASVRIHEKFGFRLVGTYREVGFKFGRWHDIHVMQRLL